MLRWPVSFRGTLYMARKHLALKKKKELLPPLNLGPLALRREGEPRGESEPRKGTGRARGSALVVVGALSATTIRLARSRLRHAAISSLFFPPSLADGVGEGGTWPARWLAYLRRQSPKNVAIGTPCMRAKAGNVRPSPPAPPDRADKGPPSFRPRSLRWARAVLSGALAKDADDYDSYRARVAPFALSCFPDMFVIYFNIRITFLFKFFIDISSTEPIFAGSDNLNIKKKL